MQFNITANVLDYWDARFNLLLKTEDSKALPYLDIVGHPTIGIGFDLTVSTSFDAVIGVLADALTPSQRLTLQTVINATYTSNTAMRTAINNQMQIFHDQNATIPETLVFASDTDPQIKMVLDNLVSVYEGRVNTWLAGIPNSTERAVLVSLSYNGGLGTSLKNAIINDNRAEAWYEIRYHTNGGASASAGLANRRYVESERFGLYSTSSTKQEIHQTA